MMEVYNSDEEQVEALKRWWKANGTSIIAGVVVGIAIIGGWNFWKSNQEQKALQASAMYEQLLQATKEDKSETVIKISEALTKEFDSTPYAELGLLLGAKAKIQSNELPAAKEILSKLQSDSDFVIKNLATIRKIRTMLATGEYEPGLQLIADMEPQSSESFSGVYEELKGDLYVALNRLGVARTAYQNALRAGTFSPLLQSKLDDISVPETEEVKE